MELLNKLGSGLPDIGSRRWREQSARFFEVEDFVNAWTGKITSLDFTTDAALYIDKNVKHYKRIYLFLKYARGDDWVDTHWSSFFRMVGISQQTSYTDLLVSDILEVGDQIQANRKI